MGESGVTFDYFCGCCADWVGDSLGCPRCGPCRVLTDSFFPARGPFWQGLVDRLNLAMAFARVRNGEPETAK